MLKYHQATYDLLTKEYIDPKRAIDAFEEYEAPAILNQYRHEGELVAQQKLEDYRNTVLAWTKLDLYQRPVTFSQSNIEKLDALEAKYHVKFPEAVREWYNLDIAPEIMSVATDTYPPIFNLIEEFLPVSEMDSIYKNSSRPDLWFFLHSEYVDQGGEPILFQINKGDNPTVYAHVIDEFRQLSESFSEFIYYHFWTWYAIYKFRYSFHIYNDGLLGMPQHFWISKAAMQSLFPKAGNGKELYFYGEHVRILGQATPRDPNVIAGGSFRADSLEALQGLITKIWDGDKPVFSLLSHDPEIKEMLVELQHQEMRSTMKQNNNWTSESDLLAKFHRKSNVNNYMAKTLQHLLSIGEIEAHPDNQAKSNPENRYRLTPKTNN